VTATLPTVSIIIPCRNEQGYIGRCLDSILANDYPHARLEVFVVDGMSTDGTRAEVGERARRHPFVRLLDNLKGITPAALNIGIRAATGDLIMRIDAHSRVEKDYIRACVEALESSGADNVGGIMHTLPERDTLLERAVVQSLSHRFGVGNSYFRIHKGEARWVDTVFGGCYRRAVFDRIGLFNEALVRTQDIELNRRLARAGGRTLLVPEVVSYYYTASGVRNFVAKNFANGVWSVLAFRYAAVPPVSFRHLTPLAMLLTLVGCGVGGLFVPALLRLGLSVAIAYALAAGLAAGDVAWRQRDPRYLIAMPLVFAVLHGSYGLGSLWGVARFVKAALTGGKAKEA
jgi:succinoglycan biosynthesis protein ExoA